MSRHIRVNPIFPGKRETGICPTLLGNISIHGPVQINHRSLALWQSHLPPRIVSQHAIVAFIRSHKPKISRSLRHNLTLHQQRIKWRRSQQDHLSTRSMHNRSQLLDPLLKGPHTFRALRVINSIIHPIARDHNLWLHQSKRSLQSFLNARPWKRMRLLRKARRRLTRQSNADYIEPVRWVLLLQEIFNKRDVIARLRNAVAQPQHAFVRQWWLGMRRTQRDQQQTQNTETAFQRRRLHPPMLIKHTKEKPACKADGPRFKQKSYLTSIVPFSGCQPFDCSSKIDSICGSIVTETVFDSPGSSSTRCQPTSRLNGSLAASGSSA